MLCIYSVLLFIATARMTEKWISKNMQQVVYIQCFAGYCCNDDGKEMNGISSDTGGEINI